MTVIGSGLGAQPNNVTNPSTHDLQSCGSGIVYVGVLKGSVLNVNLQKFGGTSGVAPYNGVAGIWLTGGCKNCSVKNCNVSECRNGINEDNFFQNDPQYNIIPENTVRNCRFGIVIDSGPGSYGAAVFSNIISDCRQSGIDLNRAMSCTVAYNSIERCGFESGNNGIFIYGSPNASSRNNITKSNQANNCGGSGIRSGPYATNDEITGNVCRNNARFGLFLNGGQHIQSGNTLLNNKTSNLMVSL